jgi:hypothetical protein
LAGDEISFQQASEVFKAKTGKDFPESYSILAQGLMYMVKEVKVMFEWFYTDGYKADITALKKTHPGLLSWSDWLEKESKHELKK